MKRRVLEERRTARGEDGDELKAPRHRVWSRGILVVFILAASASMGALLASSAERMATRGVKVDLLHEQLKSRDGASPLRRLVDTHRSVGHGAARKSRTKKLAQLLQRKKIKIARGKRHAVGRVHRTHTRQNRRPAHIAAGAAKARIAPLRAVAAAPTQPPYLVTSGAAPSASGEVSSVATAHSGADAAPIRRGRDGVSWHAKVRHWQSKIYYGGKTHHLGFFTNVSAANSVFSDAVTRFGKIRTLRTSLANATWAEPALSQFPMLEQADEVPPGANTKHSFVDIIATAAPCAACDMERAMGVTVFSMQRAKAYAAKRGVRVKLMRARQGVEEHALPQAFAEAQFLNRSHRDHESQVFGRHWNVNTPRLPFLSDILHRAFAESSADYIVYHNLDISLMPDFYVKVNAFLNTGMDALQLTRIGVEYPGAAHGFFNVTDMAGIYEMRDDRLEAHPGADMFIFPRHWVPFLDIGDTHVGCAPIGTILWDELIRLSRTCAVKVVGRPCSKFTFHLNGDMLAHNRDRWTLRLKGSVEATASAGDVNIVKPPLAPGASAIGTVDRFKGDPNDRSSSRMTCNINRPEQNAMWARRRARPSGARLPPCPADAALQRAKCSVALSGIMPSKLKPLASNAKEWFHLHKRDCTEVRDIALKFDLPELEQRWHWSADRSRWKHPTCFDRKHVDPSENQTVPGMGWIKVDDRNWPEDHDCLKPKLSIRDQAKKAAFDQGKVGWNARSQNRAVLRLVSSGGGAC